MAQIEHLFAQLQEMPRAPVQPVAQWNPRKTLDLGFRIAADGQWHCRGSLIPRARMVKLFASILRLDADGYYLVTPQIKYPVAVADAPFRAVELRIYKRGRGSGRAQELFFRTDVDDVVRADRDHPILVRADSAAPYIEVRDGLQAKITRAVYYELAQHLEAPRDGNDDDVLGVYSAGEFFAFGYAR